jgi:hypothetical protein
MYNLQTSKELHQLLAHFLDHKVKLVDEKEEEE